MVDLQPCLAYLVIHLFEIYFLDVLGYANEQTFSCLFNVDFDMSVSQK